MQNVIKVIFVTQTNDAEVGGSLFRPVFLRVENSSQHSFFAYDTDLVSCVSSSETPFRGHGPLSNLAQSILSCSARTNLFW